MAKHDLWEFRLLCDERNERSFKNPNKWFKTETTMIGSVKWQRLSNPASRLWTIILSECAARGRLSAQHSSSVLTMMCKCKAKSLPGVVQELVDNAWIQVVSSPEARVRARNERKKESTDVGAVEKQPLLTQQILLPETKTVVVQKRTPSATALVEISSLEQIEKLFDDSTLKIWSQLYPDQDFLQRVTLKAINYYNNNPKKKPRTAKGWKQTLGSWFEKDWVKHVRAIPGEKKQEGWAEGAL